MTFSSYTAAVRLLYSSNTFIFNDPQTFVFFPTTILADRFETIRSLELTVTTSYLITQVHQIPLQWTKVAGLFERMTSLQYLLIYVLESNEQLYPIASERLFLPLMQIRHVKRFLVMAGWDTFDKTLWESGEWKNRPFEVVGPGMLAARHVTRLSDVLEPSGRRGSQ